MLGGSSGIKKTLSENTQCLFYCRGTPTRTGDLLVPNQVR